MNRLGRLVSITVRAFTYSSIVSYNGLMKILYTSEQVQARVDNSRPLQHLTRRPHLYP